MAHSILKKICETANLWYNILWLIMYITYKFRAHFISANVIAFTDVKTPNFAADIILPRKVT